MRLMVSSESSSEATRLAACSSPETCVALGEWAPEMSGVDSDAIVSNLDVVLVLDLCGGDAVLLSEETVLRRRRCVAERIAIEASESGLEEEVSLELLEVDDVLARRGLLERGSCAALRRRLKAGALGCADRSLSFVKRIYSVYP